MGSNIGTLLTNLWDVDNASLAAQRFDGVWKLTLLTSMLQPVGLALVRQMSYFVYLKIKCLI